MYIKLIWDVLTLWIVRLCEVMWFDYDLQLYLMIGLLVKMWPYNESSWQPWYVKLYIRIWLLNLVKFLHLLARGLLLILEWCFYCLYFLFAMYTYVIKIYLTCICVVMLFMSLNMWSFVGWDQKACSSCSLVYYNLYVFVWGL